MREVKCLARRRPLRLSANCDVSKATPFWYDLYPQDRGLFQYLRQIGRVFGRHSICPHSPRSLCALLATYIAASADLKRDSASAPPPGKTARPVLISTLTVLVLSTIGTLQMSDTRPATLAPSSSEAPDNRIANSSPPSRATESLSRVAATSRWATSRRTSSPTR